MTYLKLPLEITKGHLSRIDDEVESINRAIELYLNTPKWTVAAIPDFGFEFAGLRFEIFDENNGTVYNSSTDDTDDPVYKKKISGTSKNLDTFASDLNTDLKRLEPRIRDIKANMTYIREERRILLVIRGILTKSNMPYEYKTVIKVWS